MKLSEFEEKLANLPDERLRQMLAKCRRDGPEVAVGMILAEASRRGMDGMDGEAVPSGNASVTQDPGAAAASFPEAASAAPQAGPGNDPGSDPSAPAFAATPAWLSEESSQGLSPIVKFILFVATFGGAIGILFKILRKG